MFGITLTRHVAAPPEKVFAVASDFRNAAGRLRGITKMELLTDGPVGVGTRFRETRVMFGREATETMTVTAFDPPRGYALGAESCGCRYHIEFRFTPKDGGTDLEMRFEGRPLTLVAKVLGFLMGPMISKNCAKESEKDLDDLKAAAEGRPVPQEV
jgi:hypothetical protein